MTESPTSVRLGKLTQGQLEAAFAHFDLGKILEVTPVPFSNWGQNIFVTTTAGAFVLRGAPTSPEQFYREQYFIRRLAEGTAVPVPWPYQINPSPAIFGWADAILADALPACDVPFVPTLVMGDFHERNVVAERVAGRWTISGVFDFPTAHVGDGEADLARPFAAYYEQDPALAQVFLEAYHRARPPRDGFRKRFALYLLYDRALIWAFGYSQKVVWWDRHLSFRDWLRGYLPEPG